jgi:thioredoxin reductase
VPTQHSDSLAGRTYDVVVVGGGPAGLAAAAAAARTGCAVALVDAGAEPGGQYWRHPAGRLDGLPRRPAFTALTRALRSGVTHLPDHDVWAVGRAGDGFVVRALSGAAETAVLGASLVLAPGAFDRQLPFPGWDLPGVYTAGGAQALLKGHGVAVGQRVVVAGTGPFLLPVAAGLAAAGIRLAGVVEANHPRGWLKHLPVVVRHAGYVAEAAAYRARMARGRGRYRPGHAILAAHGDRQVEAVTLAKVGPDWEIDTGSRRTIQCDAVAVGWGFVPRVELATALGCSTRVDVDGSVVVAVDDSQATDVPGVFAAGEACGVGGAVLSLAEGEIAGLAAAASQGRPVTPPARARRTRTRQRAFAAAMHSVYPIRDGWRTWLRPDTLLCRCEEVPVADLTRAVHELGATDARSAKLLTRAGMGWCQGRMCGYAASRLIAAESGRPGSELGVSNRPFAVPVPLGVLAQSPEMITEDDA